MDLLFSWIIITNVGFLFLTVPKFLIFIYGSKIKIGQFFWIYLKAFFSFQALFVIQNSNCISNIGDVLQKKERTLKKDYGAFTIMWSNMLLVYFRQTVKQSDSFCESLWLKHIRSFQLAASKRVLHERRCKYWFFWI